MQDKYIVSIYFLPVSILGTGNKTWIRYSRPLESHGIEGKTGKQTSNKCSKTVYNTIKERKWIYHLVWSIKERNLNDEEK